jgi:hypothetical protein
MTLRTLQYSGIICLLALFQACGSGRSLPEATVPQPDWVRSRPVMPGYYTGIGWAQKTSNIQQYQQAAKQNALADLASEISVHISSSSVLHAFESNLGFKEDYSSTIQARTQEELEGFELTEAWEDQGNYWIYYRLSAAAFHEIKERRKNDAAARSAGLLENALVSREQGDIRMNLVHLINSIEAIKNHLDNPLPVEFRGETIQLGNRIFNELFSSVSQLQITPHQQEIKIKAGQEILPSMLNFTVTSVTGPVSSFPLLANYSERPLRNNRVRTGSDGSAGFGIDRVRSSRNSESFAVTADMGSILAEATAGPVVRRLVERLSLPRGVVRINVLKPVIMLVSKEMMMGEMLPAGILAENFRRNALEAGYEISSNTGDADFVVEIRANAIPAAESGTYKNMVLQGNISVEMADGNKIYQREFEGFRGSHFDYNRAGDEAYRQAARRLNSGYFREIDEVLKSGL